MNFLVFHSLNYPLVGLKNQKVVWAQNNPEYSVIIHHLLRNWKNNIGIFQIEDSFFIDLERLKEENPEVVFEKLSPSTTPIGRFNERAFWFYPQSDTLSNSLSVIAEKFNNNSYQFVLPTLNKQNADTFLLAKNIPYKTFSLGLFFKNKPDIIVLLCDWSKEARWLISLCRFFNVKTICVQESIIDFGDNFRRMQHADYVFIQGARTVSELDRDLYFVTGNPRYEAIPAIDAAKNETCVINCNFTYNIFEEIRYQWLDDIVDILSEFSVPFHISQHPRDMGDLSKYVHFSKSSSKSVHETLSGAKFVVTRFSSLIHESLIMKVPVIYYNPHNEEMKYDFEFNDDFLFLARNKEELRSALSKIEKGVDHQLIDTYLSNHCLLKMALPSDHIAQIAMNYPFKKRLPGLKDLFQVIFFHPIIIKLVAAIKSRER
jgi:hypothetical protein